jgi:type VI protein secretion system component Hcp
MNQSKPVELSDRHLDKVAGEMTKTVDAASPTLSQLCYQGKHIESGTACRLTVGAISDHASRAGRPAETTLGS